MLNVHTAPRTTAGSSVGPSSGSVTRRKRCHRVAPSTSAASSTSFGIDVSAPRTTTIMNGKPSHVFVATFAANAVEKCANHDTGSAPSARRSAFTAPNCRWNIPFHASAVTYDGTAHGRMRSTRYAARMRMSGRESAIPSARPSARWSATFTDRPHHRHEQRQVERPVREERTAARGEDAQVVREPDVAHVVVGPGEERRRRAGGEREDDEDDEPRAPRARRTGRRGATS